MARVEVRYEQAVYGSFPFWDRGYAILAHSPGCRPEWLAGFRAACQHHGERPAGVTESGGLFAIRLARGPWTIVGVGPQGLDDRGRPGALAFHALFVDPRDYRKAGASPFAFAGALRNDWDASTRTLESGTWSLESPEPPLPDSPADPRVARIASALARGRRVALQAPAPIDALARQVWQTLPLSTRARASVATWAFGNANRFDLVALPRLAGVVLDRSYLDPESLESEPAGLDAGRPGRRIRHPLAYLGILAVVAGAGLGLALRQEDGQAIPNPPAPALDRRPPDPSSYHALPDDHDPDERRRVAEGLVDLAERFGVLESGAGHAGDDPAALMILLASRLRYRGPWLPDDALRRPATGPGGDRDLALARRWHEQVRRFADDRRLPEGFARGPLRWQLDTLCWSFHLDEGPAARLRSAAEVPHALADALAVDVPLRATPSPARDPTLAAYLEFLGRLPRR